MKTDERISELESRVAFYEQALEELSDELSKQQSRLAEVDKLVTMLAERLGSLQAGGPDAPQDEKPPHY